MEFCEWLTRAPDADSVIGVILHVAKRFAAAIILLFCASEVWALVMAFVRDSTFWGDWVPMVLVVTVPLAAIGWLCTRGR